MNVHDAAGACFQQRFAQQSAAREHDRGWLRAPDDVAHRGSIQIVAGVNDRSPRGGKLAEAPEADVLPLPKIAKRLVRDSLVGEVAEEQLAFASWRGPNWRSSARMRVAFNIRRTKIALVGIPRRHSSSATQIE